MLKLTFCLVRAPQLNHAQFVDYWTNTHGPLVARLRSALRIARYAQITIDPPPASAPAPKEGVQQYDGITELWWESAEDYNVRTTEPEGVEATAELQQDTLNFLRLSRCMALWGVQRVIF